MDDRFRLDRATADALAQQFGTPLYVLGESHLRSRMRAYKGAAEAAYARSEVTYASKANSTLAVLKMAYSEGLKLDVASEGELRAALAAGVPASVCHLHGNNKGRDEIAFALSQGVSHIVADNVPELETIASLPGGKDTKIVLRLAPGVDPITHAKISTGQDDTKFGFNVSDGAAEDAVKKCLALGLQLIGFHCHVGSQLVDPEAQRAAGEAIAGFAVTMLRHGVRTEYLNVGGGLGVRYTDADRPMPMDQYCRLVTQAVLDAVGNELSPIIAQEPGRALVAESGVTLYRVGVVKEVPSPTVGRRTYVCVDGGLSDNPRPAMYGSRYTVEPLSSKGPEKTVTISGKHCETDLLFPDIALPESTKPGDLLQVLCTGAYNASMANNYNRFPRPATVMVRQDGSFAVVQRRESWDDLLAREAVPAGI
ncbi:diaminopimelate decarboxylase [bacterium]|nr:MAG: diaminopimelate decarboxylase [bacterium]